MTPLEIRVQELEKTLQRLMQADDLKFVESFKRKAKLSLSDLFDVSVTAPTNGQVLKFNGSKWVAGTDNI